MQRAQFIINCCISCSIATGENSYEQILFISFSDKNEIFIGLDSSNNLNFYSPETKTIEAISSETEETVKILDRMKESQSEWRFICRSPCNVTSVSLNCTINISTYVQNNIFWICLCLFIFLVRHILKHVLAKIPRWFLTQSRNFALMN